MVPDCSAPEVALAMNRSLKRGSPRQGDGPASTVPPPADLKAALRRAGVLERFRAMSGAHQTEYALWIEDAERPRARERRIAIAVDVMREAEL
jgi:uncharacterized protein YdeI (YjbR/CyaY-like superfamily)